MHNVEIAWVFYEIADLLEIKEDNPFKPRAYRKAGRTIAKWDQPLSALKEDEIRAIPGVGAALAAKITELLKTGKCEYHQKLREEVPLGLLEVLAIPGLGAKTARTLYRKLGITTIDELEAAAKARKIRTLPGMGNKTEFAILHGIDMLRTGSGAAPVGVATAVGRNLAEFLAALPEVTQVSLAGSTRRMKEMIGDIDLVVASEKPVEVTGLFVKHPSVKEVSAHGENQVKAITWLGIQVDLLVVGPQEYWAALHHFTGSKEHNQRLQELAGERGLKIYEYGVFPEGQDESLPVNSEEDLYLALGLPYIPPELREDEGEIEAALEGTLPDLVSVEDIRGDLHLHSKWSDGVATIEEIVAAARQRGYEYIAITDHSKSLAIAGGLKEERLMEQHRYIDELNRGLEDFRVLRGIEVDILSDGRLDYGDELLSGMDVVIASIHSGFRQSREEMTKRMLSALKNPHVNILAHPTGRMLGRRDAYEVDLEKVFEAAAKYDKVLEINASPDRLDLNAENVRRAAKDYGLKIAVNTDAHHISKLEDMYFGIGTARRGWLEKKDVINTFTLEELGRIFGKRG
ncbi:MAG: DNA polymerase/3'-5' exonuclease PolX [Clostridia bacterium]|nr:DNA polymerase/3'-5' exonuclease PolX [Clostridia bacterium]